MCINTELQETTTHKPLKFQETGWSATVASLHIHTHNNTQQGFPLALEYTVKLQTSARGKLERIWQIKMK